MRRTSRWAVLGMEQGSTGQREALRAAVLGARGDIATAAAALDIHRNHLSREAVRLGLDWPKLLEEARAMEIDAPRSIAS